MSVLRNSVIALVFVVGTMGSAMATKSDTIASFPDRVQASAGYVPSAPATLGPLCCGAAPTGAVAPGAQNDAFPARVQDSAGAIPAENLTSCEGPSTGKVPSTNSASFTDRVLASQGYVPSTAGGTYGIG